MLARACSIEARFLRFLTFDGSTVFLKKASSRDGTSGGWGALGDLLPIDLSCPVRKRCTACLVRSTFSIGCGVLRIRTAHSMSVVGGFSSGTTGSFSWVAELVGPETTGGGGSAKAADGVSQKMIMKTERTDLLTQALAPPLAILSLHSVTPYTRYLRPHRF